MVEHLTVSLFLLFEHLALGLFLFSGLLRQQLHLSFLLGQFDHQPGVLRIHHEVDHHSPKGYTYYNIYCNHQFIVHSS